MGGAGGGVARASSARRGDRRSDCMLADVDSICVDERRLRSLLRDPELESGDVGDVPASRKSSHTRVGDAAASAVAGAAACRGTLRLGAKKERRRASLLLVSRRAVPGAAADKRTWRLAGAVEALYALPSGDLLAVRADAVVLLADPLHGDAREKDVLRGAFDTRYDTQLLLGADTPSLLPEPTGAALVLVTGGAEGVAVHVVGVYADAAPHLRAHTHAADATPARDVTSAAWLPHATLAVLQRSGALVTRRIRRGMEEDEATATTTLAPLRGAAARLVGLSASHLLVLALPTGDARKERAAALVWDVGLATVLAQAEWSLGTAPTGAAHISAAPASETHVAVLVDVPHRDVVRSSVLALPVSVPARGLLVHALHTAALLALLLFASHVQIALRLCTPGGMPFVWYTAAAVCPPRAALRYLCLYGAVAGVLYAGFYPPA